MPRKGEGEQLNSLNFILFFIDFNKNKNFVFFTDNFALNFLKRTKTHSTILFFFSPFFFFFLWLFIFIELNLIDWIPISLLDQSKLSTSVIHSENINKTKWQLHSVTVISLGCSSVFRHSTSLFFLIELLTDDCRTKQLRFSSSRFSGFFVGTVNSMIASPAAIFRFSIDRRKNSPLTLIDFFVKLNDYISSTEEIS